MAAKRTTDLARGAPVRYIGAQHPHLAGLEGFVLEAPDRERIKIGWLYVGGNARAPQERDPSVYDASDLRPLRALSKAFGGASRKLEQFDPAVWSTSHRPAAPPAPQSPAPTCAYCRQPIHGKAITFTSSGKPAKHYHELHAEHDKAAYEVRRSGAGGDAVVFTGNGADEAWRAYATYPIGSGQMVTLFFEDEPIEQRGDEERGLFD